MIIVVKILVVFCCVVQSSRTYSLGACNDCGYGGLCLKDDNGIDVSTSCSWCETVSYGFYMSDCKTIVNHCAQSPCLFGTCVPTFGGYFCQCMPSWTGQKCDMQWTDTDIIFASEGFYVYYQVQPPQYGMHPFSLIWDYPETLVNSSLSLVIAIKMSDGRNFYPTRADFVRVNIKDKCLREALNDPNRLDVAVCELLPKGEVNTFTFDARSTYYKNIDEKELIRIPTIGIVGRYIDVALSFLIVVGDKSLDPDEEQEVRLINEGNYRIFTYMINPCLVESSFGGCSPNFRKPIEYSRQATIPIRGFKLISNCDGVLLIGRKWHLQRNIEPTDLLVTRDSIPTRIDDNHSYFLHIAPFNLRAGLHMILFTHIFKGNPPMFGGTGIFESDARCWIRVTAGVPSVVTEGGFFRTMSCHVPMALPLLNLNPSYRLNEMFILTHCNVTHDADCTAQALSMPILRKTNTAKCGSWYRFTFDIWYNWDRMLSGTISFDVVIHFIPMNADLSIECLHNCFDIDPSRKVLLYAGSAPYFPQPVSWHVEREGTPIMERDGAIRAFKPLSASRILRMTGHSLTDEAKRFSFVVFTVTHGPLIAQIKLRCDNVKFGVDLGYELNYNQTDRTISIIPKYNESVDDLTYTVYQVNTPAKDFLPLVVAQHYQHLEGIVYHWNMIRICVQDVLGVESCQNYNITERGHGIQDVSFENLTKYSHANDVPSLLSTAVLLMMRYLTETDASVRAWSSFMNERLHIARLASRIRVINQREVMSALFLASVLSYSTHGNSHEGLYHFNVDEEDDIVKNHSLGISWMTLRQNTLKFLLNTIESLLFLTKDSTVKLASHLAGDILDLVVRAWSLAHQQGYAFIYRKIVSTTSSQIIRDNVFYEGEIEFLKSHNAFEIYEILFPISELLARSVTAFYGVRTVGKHVRAWSVRTTYCGILDVLNKSRGGGGETMAGYTDYILEPQKGIPEVDEMLNLTEIIMPPSPTNWDSKEFTFVVMISRNGNGDVYHTPLLTIRLEKKHGDLVPYLPEGFGISLPYMQDGITITLHLQTRYQDTLGTKSLLNEYKMILPRKFTNITTHWNLYLFSESQQPIKAKVFFGTAPILEEIEATTPLRSEEVELNGVFTRYFEILVQPPEGLEYIPEYFYVGVAPGNKQDFSPTELIFRTVLSFCKIERPGYPKGVWCKKRFEGSFNPKSVKCECNYFGMIWGEVEHVRAIKILTAPLPLIVPEPVILANIIVLAILASTVVFLAAIAFMRDANSKKKETLIFMEDNYLNDNYILIVGFYTGMKCFARANCKVAIRVEGSSSSSRVHLLTQQKQKTLQAGNDDWFVMTTSKPLGKIKCIRIWMNFDPQSKWYCRRILFYDVALTRWSFANVNKWLEITLSTEDSRLATFDVIELESLDYLLTYNFSDHYYREFRNNHLIASLFFMHRRCLSNFEQLTSILIIDILSIFFWIWFIEEVGYRYIYDNKFLNGKESKSLLTLSERSILTSTLSALLAGLITFSIRTLYRSIPISRFYQKRTTNPVYLEQLIVEGTPKKSTLSLGHVSSHKSVTYDRWAWSRKVGFLGGWKLFFTLLFGPTQFRCLNVDRSILEMRQSYKIIVLRIIVILVTFGLLAFAVWVEMFTNYWMKALPTMYLLMLALLIDTFVLNPLFILFGSFVSLFFLQVSNSEIFFISEDVKISLPPAMAFSKYVNTATKKEYKPLLSSEIDKARKNTKFNGIYKTTYIVTLLAAGCIIGALVLRERFKFYQIKSLESAYSAPGNLLNKTSPSSAKVSQPEEAADFILGSLAAMDEQWYNGQFIDKERSRWGKDEFSKPMGSTNIILIFMANCSQNTPGVFLNILRSPPCGYLSDNEQLNTPITFLYEKLEYSKTSRRYITGKSQESYPFAGQTKTVDKRFWSPYYTSLRTLMHHLINEVSWNQCRAIIFTNNYYNAFVGIWTTVDVLIEFLPTGVASVSIQVLTTRAFSDLYTYVTATQAIISFLLLWYIPLVVLLYTTVGTKLFKDHIFKCLLLLAHIFCLIVYCFRYTKDSVMFEAINDPPEVFRDIGIAYELDNITTASLLFLLEIVVLEFSLGVRNLIASKMMKESTIACIRKSCTVLLLLLLFNVIVKWVIHLVYFSAYDYQPVLRRVHGMNETNLINYHIIIVAWVVVAALYKLATGLVSIEYCSIKEDDESPSLFNRTKSNHEGWCKMIKSKMGMPSKSNSTDFTRNKGTGLDPKPDRLDKKISLL